ncbi:arrestin domain-containing protein 3-like isoform X2 [Mya arenaria]|uniref:arrestin domain-containing protein 3-like isoform X2 n=1 Tax=Mya arenaria TaxID=6604 RepID=UPI0022E75DE7|nr:arrestin domain-containing protein 3-like isoform X2 [Mya arenaria]
MRKKLERFEVALSRKLFCPNQDVQGTLVLEISHGLRISGIYITVKGRGYVHWTNQQLRGPGKPRFKDTHHHAASEEYFERTLVLCGDNNVDGEEKCYLPAGRYSYPFQCQLPGRLPCSFEGEYGYVRYWVKAAIHKGRQIVQKTSVPFSVLSPLDLNGVPDSNKSVQESTEKTMCCLCCFSGPVSASIALPKRGFVPGEPIRFGAEISNFSSRRMASCSVELKMTTLFRADDDTRSTSQQVCKVKRKQKIGRGEEVTWYNDELVVPPVPPSCLIGCNIISIKYTLELRVDPMGPAFDLSLPIEVVVGTVPHRIYRLEPQYMNVVRPSPDAASLRQQENHHHGNPNTQRPIGVPVLPTQDGQMIVNPSHVVPWTNGNGGAAGSELGSDKGQVQQRPSSRASNAPSTTSSSSTAHSKRISVIFVESVCQRGRPKVDDEHYRSGVRGFNPVYPFYRWR